MERTKLYCIVCHEQATHVCRKCHSVYYCSRNEMKRDWKLHKKECARFATLQNERNFIVFSRKSINNNQISDQINDQISDQINDQVNN